MTANNEHLLAGIFGQDPLSTKQAFDELIKDRLQVTVDDYKADFAKNIFTDPTYEDEPKVDEDGETVYDDEDPEAEEVELTDEELAALEALTDEELDALMKDAMADEEEDEETLPLDNDEEEPDGNEKA